MSDDTLVGRRLGDRYRIDALIAKGGMARVFRARDERLDRDVAVKVLSAPYADDPGFTARFLAEARAAGSISHPSLVHVYDSGSDGDAHFMVMELLDRYRSLRGEVEARGRLPSDDVLRIGRQLLAGLRVVHDRGLMHADVKSGNVMLGPGPAKLIDFGIARPPNEALEGDTSIGSLLFMSPEQLRGEALVPASDLFSLGVVLYEALTGRLPYRGDTPQEVADAHRAATVPPPSALTAGVPRRLDDVILQSLRADAGSRFQSASAMERALEAVEDEGGGASDLEDTDETDETRVVPISTHRRTNGYIPPSVPASTYVPLQPAPVSPRARMPQRRRPNWSLLGTLLILGTVALVVVLVVLPILEAGGGPQASASPSSTAVAPPGTVLVPNAVGMPTSEAIDAANAAGLDWTVRCNEDPSQPEGIIGQEPPAGTAVAPGSRFTMFSARFNDCS